jgi:serine/threonine-protein kinase
MSTRLPRTIASFEITRELGEGGMGVLFLAVQPALGREVVLKRLHRDLGRDANAAERFVREAQSAGEVHHQNVVTVYDCFEWRGDRYIAQEFVNGGDLAQVVERAAPLEPLVAAEIALQVIRGVEAIHKRGIVHRDLKPANVLVSHLGEVKITDFGIALDSGNGPALTEVGHAVGTPPYMSPEQLRGERPDARSDLFAWGVLVYEMLAGHVPFETGSEEEGSSLLARVERGEFSPLRRAAPGCPRRLARLVTRCLRPKPSRRPSDASALRGELERWLGAPSSERVERGVAEGLSARQVFARGTQETELMALRQSAPPLGPRRIRIWVTALALLALVVLGVGVVAIEVADAPLEVARHGAPWHGPEPSNLDAEPGATDAGEP